MNVGEEFSQRPKAYIFGVGLALNLLVGIVDYLTGYSVGLSVFYLAPIGFFSWFVNKTAGVFMSVLCIVTISLADYYAGKTYESYFAEFWNVFLLFCFFLIVTLLISELKLELKRRNDLILELQKASQEIKTLQGILPICASCKKIRDDQGYWKQIESYIREHSGAEFSHGLCPDCAKKLYPDIF
jgi:hypothetical protein